MNFVRKNLANVRYMQYLSAAAAMLSMAACSAYLTWPSPALPKLQSNNSPLGEPISNTEASWIVSILFIAALPGVVLASWLLEKLGPKKALLITFAFLFFPWLMIIFAGSIELIYAARFIGGSGGVIITAASVIYTGEIAEKDIRGKLGTTYVLLKQMGTLTILSVGPYVSYTWLAILGASLAVVFLCAFLFMPESPHYLVKVGENEKARLCLIRLSDNNATDDFIDEQLGEIQHTIDNDMKNTGSLWELISKRDYRKSIIIIAGLKTLQQFSGLSAIDAYLQTIIGLTQSSLSPEISSVIFGAVQVPAVLLSSFLADKLGRKPLLIVSALGCSIALTAEGIYFYILDVLEGDVVSLAWLPTTALALFVIMNPIGISTFPYVLLGEIFPANIKGIAVSIFAMYGGLLAFFVSRFFSPISEAWGMHTMFWIFAGFCALGTVFVVLVVPETKGKTFMEIQDVLKGRGRVQRLDTCRHL